VQLPVPVRLIAGFHSQRDADWPAPRARSEACTSRRSAHPPSVLSGGCFGSESLERSSLRIIGTSRMSRMNPKLRRVFTTAPDPISSSSQWIAPLPYTIFSGLNLTTQSCKRMRNYFWEGMRVSLDREKYFAFGLLAIQFRSSSQAPIHHEATSRQPKSMPPQSQPSPRTPKWQQSHVSSESRQRSECQQAYPGQ